MKVFVCFAVIFCLLPVFTAQLTGSWSAKDLKDIETKSRDILVSSRSSKDLYYALQFLGSYASQDNFCSCDRITKNAQLDVVYALRAADYCKCDFQPRQEAIRSVVSNMQSNTVPTLAESLLAAHYLPQHIPHRDVSRTLYTFLNLLVSDDNKPLAAAYTHRVLEVLQVYKDFKLDADVSAESNLVQSRIDDILASASDFLPNNNEDVHTDGSILSLLSSLSEKKIRMQPSSLQSLSEQLVHLKDTADMEQLYFAYASAKVIVNSYKGGGHYHLYPTPSTLSLPTPSVIHIHAVDVLGGVRDVESVEIVHIKGVGKDAGLFGGGVTLSPSEGLDLLALNGGEKLAAGRYVVSLKVTVEGRTLAYQTYILVSDADLRVSEVKVGVAKNPITSAPEDISVLSGSTKYSGKVGVEEGEGLFISYVLAKSQQNGGNNAVKKPHQAFVRVTHSQGAGPSVYYLSKLSDSGEYTTILSFEDTEKYAYTSGTYSLQILVGDTTLPAPLVYDIGEVALAFPPRPIQSHPLYAKSLLHTSDVTLSALPEIAHVMRPPAKRASSVMSTLFTGLTLLPLVLMILRIVKVSTDGTLEAGKGKSGEQVNGLWVSVYLVSMVAILALYAAYWFAVPGCSFTDTIYYMCILIPVHMLAGAYALGSGAKEKASSAVEDKTKKE